MDPGLGRYRQASSSNGVRKKNSRRIIKYWMLRSKVPPRRINRVVDVWSSRKSLVVFRNLVYTIKSWQYSLVLYLEKVHNVYINLCSPRTLRHEKKFVPTTIFNRWDTDYNTWVIRHRRSLAILSSTYIRERFVFFFFSLIARRKTFAW